MLHELRRTPLGKYDHKFTNKTWSTSPLCPFAAGHQQRRVHSQCFSGFYYLEMSPAVDFQFIRFCLVSIELLSNTRGTSEKRTGVLAIADGDKISSRQQHPLKYSRASIDYLKMWQAGCNICYQRQWDGLVVDDHRAPCGLYRYYFRFIEILTRNILKIRVYGLHRG